ncbi:MAG: cupin domain-containing protein [Bacteroidetes bacterium]|nr:cupin domain-containing protein [Bacteroidota bacterium]
MAVVNLADKFAQIQAHWSPKIVGSLNGQQVKLAKLKGDFVRHQHEHEDEMFLVIEGDLLMEYDHGTESISKGEFVIVPRGIYHKPIAKQEVLVMLFEPAGTVNTGDVENELTKRDLEEI